MLRRSQPIAARVDEAPGADLRAANERILATGGLRRRPQPSPVDLMREALDEPDDDAFGVFEERRDEQRPEGRRASDRPAEPFVAAPAMPLEEEPATFVVKPSAGRAGRRAMDELREQALRNVIANASTPAGGKKGVPLPRRGGPNASRIILISVALVAGGIAAVLAMQLGETAPEPVAPEVITEVVAAPTTRILVAKDSIAPGQRLTSASMEWIDWPEAAVRSEFVTDEAAPYAITEMEGSVARAEIFAGEPIREQKLVKTTGGYLSTVLDAGKRGVSVMVSAASASGGFITPNDRVDVVSTKVNDTGQVSEIILRNVKVLAINGRLGNEGGEGEAVEDPSTGTFEGNALATLELDPRQSELIVNAAMSGELTLVLRSISDPALIEDPARAAANQTIRMTSPFWTK